VAPTGLTVDKRAQAQSLLAGGDAAAGAALAWQLLAEPSQAGGAHLLLAIAGVMQGQPDLARAHAQQAVALCPHDARAYFALGRAHKLAVEVPQAQAAYRRAIELDPGYAEAHVSLGIALKHMGDLGAAIACYERALALSPTMASALANLAYARAALSERSAAAGADRAPAAAVIEDAQRAAALDPGNAQLHFNLGLMLRQARRRSDAIDAFNRALGLAPARLDCCLHLGHELTASGALKTAAVLYDRWQQVNPPTPSVMRALANLLAREGEAGQALRWAQKAAALDPDPKGWLQLCHAYQQCRRLTDSLAAGRQAIALSGHHWEMYSVPLMVASYLFEDPEPIAELHSQFGEALATSLAAAGRVDGPDLQPVSAPTSTPARAPACRAASAGQPLRVGYLSSDFINHSVAFFMGGLLQHHDRSRFEVCCYHNRGWGDSMTEQLRALGHHWVECEHLSDEALVQRIRADGIDILVDLSGHTAGGRLRVFGLGAAPMQVGYLGYPTATGVRGLHHRMSDAVIDPGDMPGTGSETPLRLPVSMFCYRPPESPPIEALAPSQRGPITFGSFNNLAKLSDRTLDLWAQVLRAVPASRLLLKAGAAADPANRQDIEAYLATRGVTADRLDLRARVEARTGHLSLYNQVDVALDTYPFNGATTTCEALWMGVPVVTLKGRTHTSRMGASILGAAGRSGWVTGSEEAFVDVASRLARDTAALSLWRHNARAALQRSRLLDERAFAADFEQALLQAWAGAPPLA